MAQPNEHDFTGLQTDCACRHLMQKEPLDAALFAALQANYFAWVST
jgi:hypothetical protein